MSFLRRKNKSPKTETHRGFFSSLGSSSSSSHQHGHSSRDHKDLATNNPYSQQNMVNQPPPYNPVPPPSDPQGAAASYYGNAPMPQYPPVQGGPPLQQQFPMMQQQSPMMQQQQGFPNPLINPNSLPLPNINGPPAGQDDPYSFLRTFDTVIVVDDSGSMAGSRWQQCAAALATIVPIVTFYDSDGIDMYFLNTPNHPTHMGIKTPAQVMEIFSLVQPRGATPTGTAIKRILKPYLEKYKRSPSSTKPLNIIVITDGVPTDDVESVLIQHAQKLDKLDADLNQVGVQFFQIGDDPGATEALKELDDALSEIRDCRDMVDTVPWRGSLQGDQMLKVVLGAVNRRLDRRRA